MTLTRRVVQERQRTDRFENEVNHAVEPNDCFLNLAQLRSATDVQHFRSRTRFPGLSLQDAIEKSIENKTRLEREAKEVEATKEALKEAAKEKPAKEKGKRKKKDNPGPAAGPQLELESTIQPQAAKASRGKKRQRAEVDRDFADGGEDLEYRPRPSKSRAGKE
jgi:hypothetical protein